MSESNPDLAIQALEAEMREFEALLKARRDEVKELMAREDPADGVFFPAEIFEAKQDAMRLEVEVELRRRKINRIRLGIDGTVPPAGGFLI